MAQQLPPGAIPADQFDQQIQGSSAPPPGAIPEKQFQSDEDKYGTGTEIAKTAVEQSLAGLTGGLSKVIETHGIPEIGFQPVTTPEAIAARERINPGTAFGANTLGSIGLIEGTGGLGGLAEGASLGAKIGVGALEGAGLGGINQATDDWSQNKPLDAQKIAASAGLGALLGGAGAGIVEGIKAKFGSAPVSDLASDATNPNGPGVPPSGPVVDPPENTGIKGVTPTTLQDMEDSVRQSKYDGTGNGLPQQGELLDALSRVEMERPVNPAQIDSLGSQGKRNTYTITKDLPGKQGDTINAYEGLQKSELVGKTDDTIGNISPGHEPVSDAYKGGEASIDAFTKQYQAEKAALAPIFKSMKDVPMATDMLPDAISRMTQAVPKIANMFEPLESTNGELTIKPYKTLMGIDESTYKAVKQAVESLKEAPNDLESLWNIRKGLDQNIDSLAQGQGPSEIRSLKSALMDQMQESSGNPTIRDTFKRYAINEQNRGVIERTFGASVGTPEFGSISKVKPEYINDKIFGNTASVQAAKNILPKEEFNKSLANWISEARASATDKGAFSSNKFGSWMRRNQDALNIAFKDNPVQLQRLRDLTTIMRILPDSPIANPSGTAKTLVQWAEQMKHMTWEGLVSAIPTHILGKMQENIKMGELNKALQGQALKNSASSALQRGASKVTDKIERGVKSLFSGVASQARKSSDGK